MFESATVQFGQTSRYVANVEWSAGRGIMDPIDRVISERNLFEIQLVVLRTWNLKVFLT